MKFNLHKFVEIVSTVGPVVLATIPGGDKIAPVIPKIVAGINEAEAIRGASGADKKQHVLNVVENAIAVANTSGKVKISADDVKAIASQGIDTVVATVHVIEGAKVVKGNTGTAPAAAALASSSLAGGSLPGVDTAPRATDLPGGKATHGHGSGDYLPTTPAAGTDAGAPGAAAPDTGGTSIADNPNAPPSEAFDGGGSDNRPPDSTDQNG